ncbi:MAG: enoyl-CoA hydratase-related protein [Dehalococcoidia bacterium]
MTLIPLIKGCSMAEGVIYEKTDRIVTITFNDPRGFHSMSPELFKAFSDALIQFRDDDDALVAIVTGNGKKAFCAGADVKSMIPALRDKDYVLPPLITRGLNIMKPVIAAINGLALGGGLEICMACDIRIASDNARFGQPEVNLGLMAGWGGTQRLARLVGPGLASELLFTGEPIDAKEALRIGLVNKVVAQDDLMATAREMAEKICTKAPLGIRATKEAIYRGLNMDLEDGLYMEKALFDYILTTEDSYEGISAFLEKRQADFKKR